MTTEKYDPWALLREARESVYQHKERLLYCDHDHETCTCSLAAKKIVLLSSIDAALAERQNSTTDVVEWEQRQGSCIHDDGVNELRVYLWGDQWHWHTVVEYRANGICATEAEAKTAAIAAARGLR
jgi:hypothetical protein